MLDVKRNDIFTINPFLNCTIYSICILFLPVRISTTVAILITLKPFTRVSERNDH